MMICYHTLQPRLEERWMRLSDTFAKCVKIKM